MAYSKIIYVNITLKFATFLHFSFANYMFATYV